jgi:putative ABC transport system permease protein
MHRLFLKIRRRRSLERDLHEELEFHREMAAVHGNPIALGNIAVLEEQARDLWRFSWIENLWRDLWYGARSLRRSPALVITAVLSLALGIGVNTGIFSLAMEFLFSQPSIRDAGSVVSVIVGGNSHSRKEVVEFVRNSGLFQDVAGENEETYINWDNGVETRPIFAAQVTKNYFTALGVPLAAGRGIRPEDPDTVAVLSHRFWRTRLHGDPGLIGRAIRLDGRAYTIVGILPGDYRTLIGFGYSPDIFVPRYLDDTILAMYARLKPGMTIGQARAGLKTVALRMDRAMPQPFRYAEGCRVTAVGGLDRLQSESEMQTVGWFFVLLLAVVGLVLLIACLNVASLLLARGAARRQELAIRLSLGAGRTRLLQQLLAESALLSLLGTGLGLLLCEGLASALERIRMPLPVPIHLHLTLDWRVTLYAAVLASFCTLACGMLPAWRSIEQSISRDLRRESRLRLQRALVVAQVALSLIVLTAGFLFLRNLLLSNSISPGFDVRHTLYANVNLPPQAYKDTLPKRLFLAGALRDLAALPGIEGAAAALSVPFTAGTRYRITFKSAGTGKRVQVFFYWNAVSPDYFRVMQIRLLRGQTFPKPGDGGAGRPVIVNKTFVERYLGGRDPIGQRYFWGDSKTPVRIVGVASDTKNLSLGEAAQPQLYEALSHTDIKGGRVQFVLKSATPPATQLHAVAQALRRIEPRAGLEVSTLYSSIGLAFLPSQAGAALLGSMGALGLLLAFTGLYGVMVYTVTRRTREIGVRLALGAGRGHIARMILASAAKLVAAGSAMGLLSAFFLVRPLALFLVPGLHPADPATFAAVAALLAAMGVAAAWGPARRAASVDPMSSLRDE